MTPPTPGDAGTDAGGDVAIDSGDPDAGDASTRTELWIPEPTGQYPVGVVSLHLVDSARQDPWFETEHPREVMARVWYPARPSDRPLWPWMTPALLTHYRAQLEAALSGMSDQKTGLNCPPDAGDCDGGLPPPPPPTGDAGPVADGGPIIGGGGPDGGDGGPIPVSLASVDFPLTHARADAPAASSDQPFPIVIYTPAHADPVENGTALVEDLASHGYVVVALSATYEAVGVEFPNERVEVECRKNPRPELADCSLMLDQQYRNLKLRRMDASFVLDALGRLATEGVNPDAEGRPLPDGFRASLNMDKIGIVGHSLGGALAPDAMANDARIDAGINLDGATLVETMTLEPPPGATPEEAAAHNRAVIDELSSLGTRVGSRPFMVVGAETHQKPDETNVKDYAFYGRLTGFKRFVQVAGTQHGSFTDSMWLYPQLGAAGLIPWSSLPNVPSVQHAVGTIDMNRGVLITRTYVRSFFDRSLKDQDDHLLDGDSVDYPEIKVY